MGLNLIIAFVAVLVVQEHAPAAGIKADAPVVGLVLQKSHINTKDECHYVALIAELEARGAKVRGLMGTVP